VKSGDSEAGRRVDVRFLPLGQLYCAGVFVLLELFDPEYEGTTTLQTGGPRRSRLFPGNLNSCVLKYTVVLRVIVLIYFSKSPKSFDVTHSMTSIP
jgi:hypothetical protein